MSEEKVSTWIEHDGSYMAPEGLRDANDGELLEVSFDNDEFRFLNKVNGTWRYTYTNLRFESWVRVTHYRCPYITKT